MKKFNLTILMLAIAVYASAMVSTNVRFKEFTGGIILNTVDISRVILENESFLKLPKGDYEIGFQLRRSPVFALGTVILADEIPRQPLDEKVIVWNEKLKQEPENYIQIPSLPDIEWNRRVGNNQKFRFLIFDKASRHEVSKLDIEATLMREIEAKIH